MTQLLHGEHVIGVHCTVHSTSRTRPRFFLIQGSSSGKLQTNKHNKGISLFNPGFKYNLISV